MNDEILRQRLIGATVILALAVVFVPMLLRGPDEPAPSPDQDAPRIIQLGESTTAPSADADRWVVVPGAPSGSRPTADTREPDPRPSTRVQPPPQQPAQAPEPRSKPAPSARAQAAPAPAPAPAPVAEGYAVQVGSFGVEQNALGLRDRLIERGHKAFVESLSTGSGRVYRVRVGPLATRAEADVLRETLHTDMAIQGLVLRHP